MTKATLDLSMLDELETQAQCIASKTDARESEVEAIMADLAPMSDDVGQAIGARQLEALAELQSRAAQLTAHTDEQLAATEQSLLLWLQDAERLIAPTFVSSAASES